jgi:hypothetical protein
MRQRSCAEILLERLLHEREAGEHELAIALRVVGTPAAALPNAVE